MYYDFRICCRSAIIIDGTHLKGKYNRILFIFPAMDGNDQIFPIAFRVGHLENDQCWTWFLTKLRNVIGCFRDMIVISDQYISIKMWLHPCFQWLHMVFAISI